MEHNPTGRKFVWGGQGVSGDWGTGQLAWRKRNKE